MNPEAVDAVARLSQCMRNYVAYEDTDSHLQFAYHFVVNAIRAKKFPEAVDEVLDMLNETPVPLTNLIKSLAFGSLHKSRKWNNIHKELSNFYSPFFMKPLRSPNLSGEIAPLSFIYRRVQNDIVYLESELEYCKISVDRLKITTEYYREKWKAARTPKLQIKEGPVPVQELTAVENMKEKCFARIYQRVRELCRFEKETDHFYHACSLLDLLEQLANEKAKEYGLPKTLHTQQVSQIIESLTKDYLEPIENSLRYNETPELIVSIFRKFEVSCETQKVFSIALVCMGKAPVCAEMKRSGKPLNPEPVGANMLGVGVYRLMRHRKNLHNRVLSKSRTCLRLREEILIMMSEQG